MLFQRTLFLDSDDATTSDGNGTWEWCFPSPIILGPPNSIVSVALTLFTFYSCIYNVDDDSNQLDITIGTTTYNLVVDGGQYSVDSLASELGDQSDSLYFGFNTAKSRFIVRCASDFSLLGSSTLAKLMGFVSGTTYTASYDSTETYPYSITSPLLCDLGGARFIEVETSMKSLNVKNGSGDGVLILARVPLAGTFGDLLTWTSDTMQSSIIRDHEIDKLTIKMRDSFGNGVDFSGTSWNMSLQFSATPQPYQSIADLYDSIANNPPLGTNTNGPQSQPTSKDS